MVKLTIYGNVLHREEIDEEENISLTKKNITYSKEFTDPVNFNKTLRGSAKATADKILPYEYRTINTEEYRISVNFNAVEAINWAKEAAEYREEDTVIDILTYWLKIFNNMRIRRALHSYLQEEYDIETALQT